ncbi:MAG: tRNA (N(6)-L-threonylcarbamoyladenosine(37)-C(2))-methylthiotransferase MtaB [Proteobacteria bacterium]|nr:tRNA (N(6)-L-threonylcarbamoyladenosine(37)-C(2))-methylthiotransferase MtaB [Pseudomonadota bacterium]
MRIAFKTFGCKANRNDTDSLYLEAVRRGFTPVEENEAADAYVINTCTVTENADRDARHQASRFKRQNQGALVALVGCYAQVGREELLKLPEVDFLIGTANKFKTLDYFEEAFRTKTWKKDHVEEARGFLPEYFPGSRNARATIKIQDGCNYKCSFCIIPEARGRSRSLSPDLVLKQVTEANRQGFREIVLTGIHLAHYGWDHGTDLAKLLEKIFSVPNGPRVRVSTLDPFEIPDNLIELLTAESRLCPHFHIALQSGNDEILRKMRRLYKAHEFTDVTAKLILANPDTFIGVDVIVGFPGEGEAEFRDTVDLLEKSDWTKLHVFSFSARRGTVAASLKPVVPEKVIAERSQILREISQKRYQRFLESQLGKDKEVVFEKPAKGENSVWQGHTENYIPTLTLAPEGSTKLVTRLKLDKVSDEKIWTVPLLENSTAPVSSLH